MLVFLMNLSGLHGHTICVPNGGGLSELYLCAPVPQTGWKYHFIFHARAEVFEETTCVVTALQLETSEFCFVMFFSYFSHCLYLFNGNETFASAGGKHSHSQMDLILMSKGEQEMATMEKVSRQYHPSHNFLKVFIQTCITQLSTLFLLSHLSAYIWFINNSLW